MMVYNELLVYFISVGFDPLKISCKLSFCIFVVSRNKHFHSRNLIYYIFQMEINNENICGNIRFIKTSYDNKTPSKDSRSAVTKKPFDNNYAASTPKASPLCLSPSNKSFGSCLSARSTRDGVKNTKLQASAELTHKVQIRKENWAREKELKARQNKICREANAKKAQELCDAAAEARKHSAEKKKRMVDRQKKEEHDMLAASLAERAQLAVDLQREAKARRRISIFLNKKMKESAKLKEREMQEEEKKKEADLLASRRINFLSAREAKKAEELRKRESLATRGVKASFDRKVDEVIANNEKFLERDIIDARLENRIDECNQKYLEKIRNRQSLANRLDVWRMQRTLVQEEEYEEQQSRVEECRVRQEDWQDIQRYKETQAKRDRESLAGRLQKWKEEKEFTGHLRSQEHEAEQIERELAQQELEDIHEYQEDSKRKRKQSLAYRLDKARKDQDFEKGQLALQQAYQEEELQMKTIDREDVKKFREQLLAARRQSLQYRTQLAVRHVYSMLLFIYIPYHTGC